jgi:hypothetical protein
MAGTAEIFIADASDRAVGVQTVCEQYDLSGFSGADIALKANYISADPPTVCAQAKNSIPVGVATILCAIGAAAGVTTLMRRK